MANENTPVFYDIDHLRKMSVGRSVEMSPIRYSIIRSKAPRFPDNSNNVPFGVYQIDTAHKKTVESNCRDTRRFYSSCFDSTVPRFNGGWATAPSVDVMYDPTRTKNSAPFSLETSVEESPIKYAIHRSRYKRFNDKRLTEGPDVVYDTETGSKKSLYQSMLVSPIAYRNMGSSTDLYGSQKRVHNYHDDLCPGMYDPKLAADTSISPALDALPLSSLVSRTPRFGKGEFTGYGLGSTYRPETDQRKWLSKPVTISKAEYLRPQYMPKSYITKPGAGASETKSVKKNSASNEAIAR
ncbi:hypothetical protein CEUSTIGMA_g1329.t1 [Chlamydomonas eustigma]|uniref:Flagellar associated protein n=1 Tax=Chlamydomonas eustigma TaxID=1157962 RepID=A0A250WT39_9CHLO|nr:hypothetical protein CEUSTIGMA_g1329.t1 [Chlamydomonas eustigma]|eukprot:GAX73879.1 hypothetical protein CEUSTIGMA_g1329.t1 [Chlamydomonas eustigma]